MPATHQNLRALLAQGNLEAAFQALVHLTAHTDDADLRQRVLTLSGQFAALKKQHLTGLLEDKDYRLQLNRITAAVAEIVDNEARESVGVTLSRPGASSNNKKPDAGLNLQRASSKNPMARRNRYFLNKSIKATA